MIHVLSTIDELKAELAAGTCSVAQASKVLEPRIKRNKGAGIRAAAFLAEIKPAKVTKTKAPKAPKVALGFVPAPVVVTVPDRAVAAKRVSAQAAYRLAFDAAPAGSKKIAGSHAYRLAITA